MKIFDRSWDERFSFFLVRRAKRACEEKRKREARFDRKFSRATRDSFDRAEQNVYPNSLRSDIRDRSWSELRSIDATPERRGLRAIASRPTRRGFPHRSIDCERWSRVIRSKFRREEKFAVARSKISKSPVEGKFSPKILEENFWRNFTETSERDDSADRRSAELAPSEARGRRVRLRFRNFTNARDPRTFHSRRIFRSSYANPRSMPSEWLSHRILNILKMGSILEPRSGPPDLNSQSWKPRSGPDLWPDLGVQIWAQLSRPVWESQLFKNDKTALLVGIL